VGGGVVGGGVVSGGVVGGGGLGLLLQTQLALFDYGGAVTTTATLLVLTVLFDLTGAALRRVVR